LGNLLRNGDFEHGKAGWESRGKVISVDSRNVLELDTTRRELQSLITEVKTARDMRLLKITFEVKAGEGFTADGASAGDFRMRISKPHGHAFRDITLKPGGGWQTIRWDRDVIEGQRDFTFEIIARAGTGPLYFTNFVVIGVE